jgi:hypothetical protein
LAIVVPTFILSAAIEPGFLRKKYDFVDLVEEMIESERDLWNLCTYCELIKSQSSFHCLYCGSCIELFDHHCPYINNCLGNKNTKFFLIFVISYFMFLVVTFLESIRFLYDTAAEGEKKTEDIIDGNIAITLIILVSLNFPLATY